MDLTLKFERSNLTNKRNIAFSLIIKIIPIGSGTGDVWFSKGAAGALVMDAFFPAQLTVRMGSVTHIQVTVIAVMRGITVKHATTPQKKAKTTTDLTVTQEQDMASWLEVNDLIYNKKLNAYKDFRKKDALWESKAAGMDKNMDILKTWYRSIRTRFTRLMHRKSGDGSGELTERDRWILQNFAWLNFHVVEVKKKTTVSMRDKISAASSVEDVNDEFEKPPEAETTSRQRLEPLPSVSNNKKAIQEEERLLSNIANRGEQSMAF
uniref:MADF domain-containing protein n=1 Tax=Magallana gigas TaxID=29159 RepID=K1PYZ7_MAGGI